VLNCCLSYFISNLPISLVFHGRFFMPLHSIARQLQFETQRFMHNSSQIPIRDFHLKMTTSALYQTYKQVRCNQFSDARQNIFHYVTNYALRQLYAHSRLKSPSHDSTTQICIFRCTHLEETETFKTKPALQ
jgi:hypothetical protein